MTGRRWPLRRRTGQALLVAGAVLVVTTLVWGLTVVLPADDAAEPSRLRGGAAVAQPAPPGIVAASASPSPTPSPSPTTAAGPTSSPTRQAAPAPAATPAPPRRDRAPAEQPPPPAPEPPPSDRECPYYEGENASRAEVGAALDAAAAHRFWTVSQVSLPPRLLKAVAEQESGWQSAIIACDGGIGAMQVMPATADWMNQRFGVSLDVHTLHGNTMLGSAFLQWLIKYFGDVYFDGDYTIRDEDCQRDPEVPDHREWCLLNAVISAYNYGHGAVDAEFDNGDDVYFPNHWYIEPVRALMARF